MTSVTAPRLILEILAKRDICNLLIEGGSKIFSSFLYSNYYDELMLLRGNFFIGSGGMEMLNNSKKNLLRNKLKLCQLSNFENDIFEIYKKDSKNLILE